MRRSRFFELAERQTPAVILYSGNVTGIGLVRALGRRGVPVWAIDTSSDSVVLRSRFAYGSVCADTHYDEEGCLRDLIAVGKQLPQRAVLFPSHDDYVAMLPRHVELLSQWFIIPLPPSDTVGAIGDKEQQFRAAWRAGVDTPETAFVTASDQLHAAAERVPFPALLKPAVPLAFRRRVGVKVIKVDSPSELGAAYEMAAGYGTLLLQEFVPGGDDQLYNFGSYLNAESQPLAQFTRRKLRQHPRTFGEIRFGESMWVPEVADAGLRLLQELRYHGISGVEFKRDPRDGRYKLMEINGRSTIISHTLAPALGVDIPYVAYRDATGDPISAPRQIDGVRWIQCSTDVPDSIAEILRGEMSLSEWLCSLRGTRVDGILALDDPVPGLLDAASAFRARLRLTSRVRRRIARYGHVATGPD